jgi:hypothetical protein
MSSIRKVKKIMKHKNWLSILKIFLVFLNRYKHTCRSAEALRHGYFNVTTRTGWGGEVHPQLDKAQGPSKLQCWSFKVRFLDWWWRMVWSTMMVEKPGRVRNMHRLRTEWWVQAESIHFSFNHILWLSKWCRMAVDLLFSPPSTMLGFLVMWW